VGSNLEFGAMEDKMSRYSMLALGSAAVFSFSAAASAQEVNLYTAREPALIKPVLEAFTKDTGVKVNVIFAQNGLEERILAEGANSPADLLLTVDVSRLVQAASMGITQKIASPALDAAVPAAYRDADGQWFATTLRARVIYASKDRVKEQALTYEDLADPKWKGKICIRDGQYVYNTALFAHAVARMGAVKAEEWLKGIKANLAKKPSGGDRDVAKDIAAGVCDIGIANTYYFGLMANGAPEQKAWTNAVKVILPSFVGGGTHVNVSGFAMAKNAPNRVNAQKLAEWLVSNAAQDLYARQNYEHPIRPGIALDPIVSAFGELKADSTPIVEIAKNRKLASELVDKVGFNAGPGS
jgi:iron(III) transport system substrate-binding protein